MHEDAPPTVDDGATLLRGALVELHRVTMDERAAVMALRASDAVAAGRWPTMTLADITSVVSGEDGQAGWWIVAGAERVGFIQHYQELDDEYRHAGMDIFLVARGRGRGFGTDAVRTLARHLVHDLGHHRLIIDPAADNAAAIRCYEKVGFRRVGVMREYERGADGSFHDGLLMDLLRSECGDELARHPPSAAAGA